MEYYFKALKDQEVRFSQTRPPYGNLSLAELNGHNSVTHGRIVNATAPSDREG